MSTVRALLGGNSLPAHGFRRPGGEGRVSRVGLLAVLVLSAGTGSVTAQPPAPEGVPTPAATLPVSNEAMLLVSQARLAIDQGDYRLAIALFERLMQDASDLVPVPPGRTYYPVWRQAARLLDQWPPEGLQLYQRLYDAEVSERMRRAARTGDVPTLRELFRTYRGSSAWPGVACELVAQLMDGGQFAEAIETIRLLAEAGVPVGVERRAQLVAALSRAGQWRAAERALAEIEADPGVRQWPGRAGKLEALRASVEAARAAEEAHAGAGDLAPAWAAGAVWQERLRPSEAAGLFDDDAAVADALERLETLPLHTPVVDEGTLVVRLRGTVWAYDALTLTPLWRVPELRPAGPGLAEQVWPGFERVIEGLQRDGDTLVSIDAALLLSHALRHSVSTGFGLVLTIESLPLLSPEALRMHGRLFGEGRAPAANELVARELSTGRLAWRRGGELDDPLYGVAFQDGPIVLGDHLCVALQRGNELHLCLLDPGSGELVREVPVVGPPTYFSAAGGRCLLTTDETSLFVCTGNGVVAALDRRDLSWKWATTYPSTLAQRRRAGWWSPQDEPREFGSQPPVIAGDLLVLAPADSPHLLALDRFTGEQRWHIERVGQKFLLGALEAGVVVGGDRIACLADDDGTALRWRSVLLAMTGRPAIRGQRVFVPTRDGIVVLDGRTGKVVTEPPGLSVEPSPKPQGGTHSAVANLSGRSAATWARLGTVATANLVSTPQALLAVSPNSIVKYADVAATRRKCEGLLAQDPADARARLALAWVQRLEGTHGPALATLEGLDPPEPHLAAARQRLLTEIFVALASESDGGTERLDWLRKAAGLSASEQAGARLAVLIGRTLEQGGAWDEAAEQYTEMLRADGSVLVRDPDDPARASPGWLHAVGRLRVTLPRLDRARVSELLRQRLEGASPRLLQRLRLAVSDADSRAEIDRALALAPLPPELRVNYLPAGDSTEWPMEERRQLHLARWETQVGLGLLEQAREDQRVWYQQFSAAEGDEQEDEEDARRVRRIEKALARVEQASAPPFGRDLTNHYQWKAPRAELIVDARHPGSAMRGWIPVRELDDLALTLRSAVLGREQARTVAALETGPQAQAAVRQATNAILWPNRNEGRHAAREAWPAAVCGHLAAVPARGGLVCLGLAPERGGGRRLWEYPIPEWTEIPRRFAETAVAGPHGVYVLRRRDRVELIGWADGQTWWQRELPGMQIERLDLTGGRLVVLGRDGAVISVDALLGDQLGVLPTTWGTPRAVAAVAHTVVVWSEDGVAGFGPVAFERRWARPAAGVMAWSAEPKAGWLAYRDRSGPAWTLLDARTGEDVFAGGLGEVGDVAVLALDRRQLLVAGFSWRATEDRQRPLVRLAAHDPLSGRRRWECEVETLARVNLTQLLAHPDVIPLLVARSAYDAPDVVDYHTLALQLVDKRTGALSEPVSILGDFRTNQGGCAAYLLATPGRIIVQANGSLAAYGTATARQEP